MYLLVLLVGLTYVSAIGNGFVWDDTIFTIGNPVFKKFDLHAILFGKSNGFEYLPLRDLTYALDYLYWGESPAGFHITNIIIAAATSLVVFLLVEEAIAALWLGELTPTRRWCMSFVTTAVYLLHPVQAQVINWISCRNHLLAGFFCFLSLLFALRAIRRPELSTGNYLCSLLFFIAALLSKVTAIILPVVLLMLFLCLPKKRSKLPVLPFFGLAAIAYFVQKGIAVDTRLIRLEDPEFGIFSAAAIAAKAVAIPFFYLGKILIPQGFAAEYEPLLPRALTDYAALASLAGLLLLLYLAWAVRRRFPLVAWGILFYLTALVPVLNIFPTHPMVADRYVYLPSLGIALAITGLGMALPIGSRIPIRAVAATAVISLLAILAHQQNAAWHDEEHLWRASIKSAPASSRSYANLGVFYFMRQKHEQAFALFEKAAELDPSKPNLEFSRGIVAFRRQDYPEALDWFHKGLARNEHHLPSLYFSGLAAMKMNDMHQASAYFRKMDDSPDADAFGYRRKRDGLTEEYILPALKNELDLIDRQTGLNAGDGPTVSRQVALLYSLRRYRQVIAISEAPATRSLLTPSLQRMVGSAYAQTGNRQKAEELLAAAAGGAHPDQEAPILLARLYVRELDFGKAVGILKSASQQGNAEAAVELGSLYFRLGNPQETVKYLDLAESIKPDIRMKGAVYRKKLQRDC